MCSTASHQHLWLTELASHNLSKENSLRISTDMWETLLCALPLPLTTLFVLITANTLIRFSSCGICQPTIYPRREKKTVIKHPRSLFNMFTFFHCLQVFIKMLLIFCFYYNDVTATWMVDDSLFSRRRYIIGWQISCSMLSERGQSSFTQHATDISHSLIERQERQVHNPHCVMNNCQ